MAISNVQGFIAYDCGGHHLNITSFNRLGVELCDLPPAPKVQQIPRIKLLQRTETYPVHFKSCLISADYIITRCSAFDDAQVVEGGYFSEVIELGSARCSELHQRQAFTFPLGETASNIKLNETFLISHTVAGTVDRFGKCKGVTFKNDKGSWEDAVVQAKFKILISEGTAIANNKENVLILPTGTRMKLSDNYGINSFKGETIWTNSHLNCEDQDFIVLYDGPASLVTSNTIGDNINTHTYIVKTEKIVFALKKIRSTFACEIPVILTEHSQLLILIDQNFLNFFKAKDISPQNTDLLAYINTKFVYIDNVFKSSITSLYNDLIKKQCELEREVLQ